MLIGLRPFVERRKYLRVEVYPDKLQVTVGVLGIAPTNGVVLNISRGGMKVCLEHEIPKSLLGNECLIRIPYAAGRISPEAMLGQLLRMEAKGQYAIEFDSPLEVLNMGNDRETVESGSERQAKATVDAKHLAS